MVACLHLSAIAMATFKDMMIMCMFVTCSHCVGIFKMCEVYFTVWIDHSYRDICFAWQVFIADNVMAAMALILQWRRASCSSTVDIINRPSHDLDCLALFLLTPGILLHADKPASHVSNHCITWHLQQHYLQINDRQVVS
jgi:hypothetical protein